MCIVFIVCSTGRPPKWGPKGDANIINDGVEDCFIKMFGESTLQYIEDCTNWYAAGQAVKVVKKTKNRVIFRPCEEGSPGQRWRCGDKDDVDNWKPITRWHILMVFAIQLRAGAKRLRSAKTLWMDYDDIQDDVVVKHVSKKAYLAVLQMLCFADYKYARFC